MLSSNTSIGFLAHVDAGKTSLIESLLYDSHSIRTLGRVDHQDAFLDTDEMEKRRGITIFSKLASMDYRDRHYTLIDTPGHVDFSLEMERSLSLLDYAVLVIEAGKVPGHTKLIARMLERENIPTVIFLNKMDKNLYSVTDEMEILRKALPLNVVDMEKDTERIAEVDDDLTEKYLSGEDITLLDRKWAWNESLVTPVLFGSALKNEGIDELLEFLSTYTELNAYPEEFGFEVAKLYYEKGSVLALGKVVGGELEVKSYLGDDKVDQIRLYSGTSFSLTQKAKAGDVVVLQGLDHAKPGDAFGIGFKYQDGYQKAVLEYALKLPEKTDPVKLYSEIKILNREMPELNIRMENATSEILCSVMGKVQMEVLASIIKDRFHVDVEFGQGRIVYKESILSPVEGIGHYEPLRHYAEVHLVMEPLPRNSGIEVVSKVNVNDLDLNWQRLIATHVMEKVHRGVLTGSELTDVRFSITAGRAHLKHTEGGDFREATYRAIREGLMKAKSVLLEPIYSFELEIPESSMGRALSDLVRMHGSFEEPENNDGVVVIRGKCPVSTISEYQSDVTLYTHGEGSLTLSFSGYDTCHDADEVIERIGYDAERDTENPAGSVFCSHGAGFFVPWQEVESYMHIGHTLV